MAPCEIEVKAGWESESGYGDRHHARVHVKIFSAFFGAERNGPVAMTGLNSVRRLTVISIVFDAIYSLVLWGRTCSCGVGSGP